MPSVDLKNRWGTVVATTLLDEEDVEMVSGLCWTFQRGYARCKIDRRTYRLHNLLLPKREGYTVDHANRNSLDNRRANLRYLTHKENCQNRFQSANTSGYIGVSPKKFKKGIVWRAQITAYGKRTALGYYDSPEEAAAVYDVAARCFYGQHAMTNAQIVQGAKSAG